jgi:hypothetical protein
VSKKISYFYPSAKISKTTTTKISVTRKEESLKGGENKERKFENKIFSYLNCPHSAVLGNIFCLPKELRKNIQQISIPISKLGRSANCLKIWSRIRINFLYK